MSDSGAVVPAPTADLDVLGVANQPLLPDSLGVDLAARESSASNPVVDRALQVLRRDLPGWTNLRGGNADRQVLHSRTRHARATHHCGSDSRYGLRDALIARVSPATGT